MKRIVFCLTLILICALCLGNLTAFAVCESEKESIKQIENVEDVVYLTHKNITFISLRLKPIFSSSDREDIIESVKHKAREFNPNNEILVSLDLSVFAQSKKVESILDGNVEGNLKKEVIKLYNLYRMR